LSTFDGCGAAEVLAGVLPGLFGLLPDGLSCGIRVDSSPLLEHIA
jgi:hypothetical protein